MADEAKPGRAKPVPERFEVFDSPPTAHLTEEQKTWKAKLRPAAERSAVLAPQPTLVLKVHLVGSLQEADQVALAADIYGLVQALSETERELGGGGLVLADQKAEAGTVILTLRHLVAEGAAERASKLAEMLNNAVAHANIEKASVGTLLHKAMESPVVRVKLLLAGSRAVSRCEVQLKAA